MILILFWQHWSELILTHERLQSIIESLSSKASAQPPVLEVGNPQETAVLRSHRLHDVPLFLQILPVQPHLLLRAHRGEQTSYQTQPCT